MLLFFVSLVEFWCDFIWTGLFLVGKHFIAISVLSFVRSLFKLLISSWFNFGSLGESRNSSISFRFSSLINEGYAFKVLPYNNLYFFGVMFPFSFFILLIWLLPLPSSLSIHPFLCVLSLWLVGPRGSDVSSQRTSS